MLGVTREGLRGTSSTSIVAEAQRPRFVEGLGKFLAGHGRIAAGAPMAITGRRHSGEEFPAEISLSWFDGADGRYVTGVVVDLSERVRAEAAARDAEERWTVALTSGESVTATCPSTACVVRAVPVAGCSPAGGSSRALATVGRAAS